MFRILGRVFWILGRLFGFWEVFRILGRVFWILGRVSDSGTCFWILGSVLSLQATVVSTWTQQQNKVINFRYSVTGFREAHRKSISSLATISVLEYYTAMSCFSA